MDEVLRQALMILRAMWQHRYLGVAVAWAVGIIAAGAIWRIPDQYEASARVFVDTQSILKPLMSGLAVQPNIDQQVMMLSRTLINRPNVEKLIRMADLDLGSKSKASHEELVEHLMKNLEIKSTSRDNLYTLAYRDSKSEQAKRVVQSLVSIFVESNLGEKRKDSDTAMRFIEDQIKAVEKKLEDAESRLKDFKLRNVEMQLADGKGGADRLVDVLSSLNAARLELREAENSRDALRRQLAGEEAVFLPETPGRIAGEPIPEIDSRIDVMKRNLDTLLQRYTEQHPDVVGTRRVIQELEDQKRKEVAARRTNASTASTSSVNGNPVYQQLKVSLAESEAAVASLQARVAEYEARYQRGKESVKSLPQIEAEYTQLNRDYDIHKRNYEQLVARRESANLSGELESVAGVADFRLIDPPRVTPQPVAPNRLLLLPVALLGALLAGAFAAFIASQIRPLYMDARSLREGTGLPVLGTVTLVANESLARQERRSVRRVLIALGMLVAAYGTGIAAMFLTSSRTG